MDEITVLVKTFSAIQSFCVKTTTYTCIILKLTYPSIIPIFCIGKNSILFNWESLKFFVN